ncbi:hypothetical protein FF38_12732 [Lucilia cuprina]|uniref:Uncharacterized protein n=1 Tax=Lucilia cuprina TaxID=7375 RepID=A0A0L0CLP4_LUCCU|nr:hypothetical protein FF38_12732 [Lucilia cuprina]
MRPIGGNLSFGAIFLTENIILVVVEAEDEHLVVVVAIFISCMCILNLLLLLLPLLSVYFCYTNACHDLKGNLSSIGNNFLIEDTILPEIYLRLEKDAVYRENTKRSITFSAGPQVVIYTAHLYDVNEVERSFNQLVTCVGVECIKSFKHLQYDICVFV